MYPILLGLYLRTSDYSFPAVHLICAQVPAIRARRVVGALELNHWTFEVRDCVAYMRNKLHKQIGSLLSLSLSLCLSLFLSLPSHNVSPSIVVLLFLN